MHFPQLPLAVLLVTLSAGSSGASIVCTEAASGRTLTGRPSELSITISGPGVWSCDAPGAEPRDAVLTSGQSVRVELPPAKPLVLHVGDEPVKPVTIEILSYAERGVETLARRVLLPTNHRLTLPVASRSRLVRVLRDASAPVTLIRSEGDTEIHVPSPRDGGEVVGYFAGQSFVPKRVRLDDSSVLRDVQQRVFVVPATAGAHHLVAEYAGGLLLPGPAVEVQKGQTTFAWPWQVPDRSAVRIAVPETTCLPTQPFTITTGNENVLDVVVDKPCDVQVEGLPAGTYDIVHNGSATVRADAVRTEVNRILGVELREERTIVEGRAEYSGGEPASSVLIEFQKPPFTRRVRTGEDGSFTIALAEDGGYRVALFSTEHIGVDVGEYSFKPGHNEVVVRVPGGSISIHVVNATDGEIVMIGARGPQVVFAPLTAGERNVVLRGLPEGDYVVTAQSAHATSRESLVTISRTASMASVELELESQEGELLVTDAQRRPISASARSGRTLPAVKPGTFDLRGILPGAEITIRSADHLPVCVHRLAGKSQAVTVTRPGNQTLTLLIDPPITAPFGYIKGLPGSTCYVALSDMPVKLQPEGSRTKLTIEGLPPGRYVVHLEKSYVADVPSAPIVITR